MNLNEKNNGGGATHEFAFLLMYKSAKIWISLPLPKVTNHFSWFSLWGFDFYKKIETKKAKISVQKL